MVFTIRVLVFLLFYFVTEILDVPFSLFHTIVAGGRHYRFDNVKVVGKSIIILECKDFTSWRRGILVYQLVMMEGKRGDRFKCVHDIVIESMEKQVEA